MIRIFAKYSIISFFVTLIFLAYTAFAFWSDKSLNFDNIPKTIKISDNGLDYEINTATDNVGDVLKEKNISLGDHDQILPALDAKIYPGANIEIKRALKIKITADGKSSDGYTLAKTISQAVAENGITLGRLDKTVPDMETSPQNNMAIAVIRINVEEVTADEDIDFKTISATDSKMSWRDKKVTTPGEKGKPR